MNWNKWLMIFTSIYIVLLVGCSSQPPPKEVYSSIAEGLSSEEKDFLKTLQVHVEKFDVLNQELDMILTKMKNDDDLEAAIETMEIAKQEAQYIYNLIELEGKPESNELHQLQTSIQESINNYIEGMNIQLKGITSGEPKKTDEGFEKVQAAKQELKEFLSLVS